MNCNSCGAQIPADSMFCPECGARQDVSASSGFAPPPQTMHQPNQGIPTFPGQQRNFDPVSGQVQRTQQDNNMQRMGQIPPEMLQGMAQGLQQQQNLPPGTYPQQPVQGGYQPNQFPPQQPQGNVMPMGNQAGVNDMPNLQRGPSLGSGAMPSSGNVSPLAPGGTKIAHNPANSPTDAMVNRLAEAERAVKDERRNQWLSMNQSPASSVLANLGGGELPAHLRAGGESGNAAAEIMAGTMNAPAKDAPSDALLRRISEVAVRRVARKRGVAVEAPQTKLEDDQFMVNVTYIDDGRVLDTPEDLTQAFEHAIQTELALKGYDLSCSITMFRSKDGVTQKLGEEAEDDAELFACEICGGLVKETDTECPHCGAVFEDDEGEDDVQAAPARSGPPGPTKRGPPGPKKGGPPGPKKGGPGGPPGPKKGGPPGPKKGGPPGGPKRSGPGGPPGPKKSGPPGGPKKGGPGGPPGPKKSGPPGPKKGGPGGPPGPKKSGPPGPKKSGPPGGPKKGGPGGPPGPKKGGPGGPPGPKKKGPPGGPKKGGPPGGPKRGPPGR